jgi:hypothetical protein
MDEHLHSRLSWIEEELANIDSRIAFWSSGRVQLIEDRGDGRGLVHNVTSERIASLQEDKVRWRTALASEWRWIASQMDDSNLLAAYQRTTGEPGDPDADALLAEIERRGLDA